VTTGTAAGWSALTRGGSGTLYGVALLSAKDGWAVGDTGAKPLIMRLTASGWKATRTPAIKGGFLRDVYIAGSKKAIAIGGVHHRTGTISPLVLVWNGRHWSRTRVPGSRAELYGVTGERHGSERGARFWISGYDPGHPEDPYLLRYEGGKWRVDRGERTGGDRTVRLQAVSHVSGLTMAVGHVVDGQDRYTDVIETLDSVASKAAGNAPGKTTGKAADEDMAVRKATR
ncbi:MAG TPA: hypothetical protein VIR33_18455, partial [Thermopolyspora sp.]